MVWVRSSISFPSNSDGSDKRRKFGYVLKHYMSSFSVSPHTNANYVTLRRSVVNKSLFLSFC